MQLAAYTGNCRATLFCVACDVPATRKACGFLGHNTQMGCSKCIKENVCTEFGKKLNYGEFAACSLRCEEDHRREAELTPQEITASGKDIVEREYGSRFILLEYFDNVRYRVIDHMLTFFTNKYVCNEQSVVE